MKSNAQQPTDENILNTFLSDTIGRSKDVLQFISLLNAIDDSYSIALDGNWGSGKTFFVKQTIIVLNALNESITSYDSEESDKIRKYLQMTQRKEPQIEVQPFVSCYYNAWANDNDVDPVLSLTYSILQCAETDYSFEKGPDFIRVLASIAEFFTGLKANAIIDALKSKDPLSSIIANKDILNSVNEFLESLLPEQGNRLLIFVDELDRCKPSYAVQMLERIKHYFSNDRVTFVFSINMNEILHTIKRYYGSEFDGSRYLDRFFDMRISLPPADMRRFYQQLGIDNGRSWVFEGVCKAVIEEFRFELREILRFYQQAKIAAYRPTHGNNNRFGFSDGKAEHFCLLCVVPIMIGLKISNLARYNSFVQGNDDTPLYDVLKGNRLAMGMLGSLLSQNETYSEKKSDQDIVVYLQDKLSEVYNALFNNDYTAGVHTLRIGEMSFDKDTRKRLLEIVNLWSEYADFDIY